METRTIELSLDTARRWYEQGGELKEMALGAFDEKKLIDYHIGSVQRFLNLIALLSVLGTILVPRLWKPVTDEYFITKRTNSQIS